ncbi:hypothetical protein SAY86_032012 [Trapa natans]|nr:hypothetical protein SAY86_032012 [Trapa natans]
MATFIWSLWEIRDTSCFMDNRGLLVIRLVFGVVSQFWCSYITFPLYVIVTQMGSRFKKTVISESVRSSLSGWQGRAKRKQQHSSSTALPTALSVTSLDSLVDGDDIERISDSLAHHVHDIESVSSSVQEDISVAPRASSASDREDYDLQLEGDDPRSQVDGYPVFDGHDSEHDESELSE